MSFERDPNARTRGVGAIAALDHVSSAGRDRARAQARLLAIRDRRMANVVRSQPLSGDFGFARRRKRSGYDVLGAIKVATFVGPTRRPVLDPGGVIEGEGKGSPLGPRTGHTITPPPGGGAPTPPTPIRVMTSQVPIVLDSKTSPTVPSRKPIRHPRLPPKPPTPTTPSPVVLLPVPNVTLPYPGSSGGGGGGGSSAPLPDVDPADELVMGPAIPESSSTMSTGKKVAIAAGIAGALFLLYENYK